MPEPQAVSRVGHLYDGHTCFEERKDALAKWAAVLLVCEDVKRKGRAPGVMCWRAAEVLVRVAVIFCTASKDGVDVVRLLQSGCDVDPALGAGGS